MKKQAFVFSTILLMAMVSFTSCERFDDKKPLTHNNVSPVSNSSGYQIDPYGPITDTALAGNWNRFKEFILEHAISIEQNYNTSGQLDEQLKTVWYDSVLVTGVVSSTTHNERVSIQQKMPHSEYTRDVALVCCESRRIEIGPHRHAPCGQYSQSNQTATVVVRGNNGATHIWEDAPIQTQWGWTSVPDSDVRPELGDISRIEVYLR